MKMPLFFSGGTALKTTAEYLAANGRQSIHLVTTHDSGGSSRVIRQAFNMPAPGDLRNRLLALASPRQSQLRHMLAQRLPLHISGQQGRQFFLNLFKSPAWHQIESPRADRVLADLEWFGGLAPPNFDFAGASIGNLALTGAYLRHNRDLVKAVGEYAQLLQIEGAVAPTCSQDLHLVAKLEDNSLVHGQHLFKSIRQPIAGIWLTKASPWSGLEPEPVLPGIEDGLAQYLQKADLLCYGMGSFHSSLLANLLSPAIGRLVSASSAKKIFIPNIGYDPEAIGLNVAGQVEKLLGLLSAYSKNGDASRYIDAVLLDIDGANYVGIDLEMEGRSLERMGIQPVFASLAASSQRHDPKKLLKALDEYANGSGRI